MGEQEPQVFLSAEQIEFHQSVGDVTDKLTASGWQVYGAWDFQERRLLLGFLLETEAGDISVMDATEALPITGENGRLLPGFVVERDEDFERIQVAYTGPLNEQFIDVVDAMEVLGQSNSSPE